MGFEGGVLLSLVGRQGVPGNYGNKEGKTGTDEKKGSGVDLPVALKRGPETQ